MTEVDARKLLPGDEIIYVGYSSDKLIHNMTYTVDGINLCFNGKVNSIRVEFDSFKKQSVCIQPGECRLVKKEKEDELDELIQKVKEGNRAALKIRKDYPNKVRSVWMDVPYLIPSDKQRELTIEYFEKKAYKEYILLPSGKQVVIEGETIHIPSWGWLMIREVISALTSLCQHGGNRYAVNFRTTRHGVKFLNKYLLSWEDADLLLNKLKDRENGSKA